jgi:hypothetical protein
MNPVGRLFARGFLLQALFNPVGQQRGGFVWILDEGGKSAGREPFNANPTLAGYAIGLAHASTEEEFARRRAALTSALGALGDRIVWGILRPMAVILSLIASAGGAIPAAAVLLLVYNPPELCMRWRGTQRGLQGIRAVAGDLDRHGLPWIAPLLGRLTAALLGCLAGFWLVGSIRSGPGLGALAGCAGVAAAVFVLRRRTDPCGVIPAVGSLVFGLVWLLIEGL